LKELYDKPTRSNQDHIRGPSLIQVGVGEEWTTTHTRRNGKHH